MAWSTLSKAAFRSSAMRALTSWFSMASNKSLTNLWRDVSHEWWRLYANWVIGSSWFSLTCSFNPRRTAFSVTFDKKASCLQGNSWTAQAQCSLLFKRCLISACFHKRRTLYRVYSFICLCKYYRERYPMFHNWCRQIEKVNERFLWEPYLSLHKRHEQ